jgi:hypothetical protein
MNKYLPHMYYRPNCEKWLARTILAIAILCLVALASGSSANAQAKRQGNKIDKSNAYERDEYGDIGIPDSDVHLIKTYPIGGLKLVSFDDSPQASGPAAVWSNVTNFTGNAVANGGSANQAGNQITTLVADDAVFAGTAPNPVLRS